MKLDLPKFGKFGFDPTLIVRLAGKVVYKYIDNTMEGQCSPSEIGASLNKSSKVKYVPTTVVARYCLCLVVHYNVIVTSPLVLKSKKMCNIAYFKAG